MKFKCSHCGANEIVKIQTSKMMAFNYYKDNKKRQHTGIICLKCGTIHDCLISFIKIIPALLKITNPYKVVDVELLPIWLAKVQKHMQDLDLNCMEAATMAVGIPKHIIDLLKDKGTLGECFEESISITHKEYNIREVNFMLQKMTEHFDLKTENK